MIEEVPNQCCSLRFGVVLFCLGTRFAQAPHPIPGGYALRNGWRIKPVGKAIPKEDLILNVTCSRDGKAAIARHNTYNPGARVINAQAEEPEIDGNDKIAQLTWGAKASMDMDRSKPDRAPMLALNEIIWKSVKGLNAEMPLPVHAFWFQTQ